MPASSIIIVNRNGGRILAECIESVRKNTRDYEILLLDNASTDDTISMVKPGSDLRLVKLPSNLGFAGANNIGIRESEGKYVVLLNPDTVVTRSWLERLINEAEKSSITGLVAPKLLRPNNPPIIDSTGHIFQYQTGRASDRGQGEPDNGRYDEQTELLSCCFACALIKREVFEDIGLLDSHMFLRIEDVDFGLRATLAGWRIVFRPDSIVYHMRGGSSTLEALEHQINYLSNAYQLHMILKIYQRKNALLLGGGRLLMYARRIAAGIMRRDLAYSRGYLATTIWTLVHFPLRERLFFQRRRRATDKILIPAEPRR
jgi:GT2 family glycosyltransferase